SLDALRPVAAAPDRMTGFGSMGYRRGMNQHRRGASAPDPDQEALPPGPRPRAVTLGTIHFGWVWEEGRPRQVAVGPPPTPTQWTDFKGPRPLTEVQEAAPPGGFQGGALTSGRHITPRMTGISRSRIFLRNVLRLSRSMAAALI